jgi:hypothetical protein
MVVTMNEFKKSPSRPVSARGTRWFGDSRTREEVISEAQRRVENGDIRPLTNEQAESMFDNLSLMIAEARQKLRKQRLFALE